MKKLIPFLMFFGFATVAFALPYYMQTQSVLPDTTNKFYIGTSSPSLVEYKGIYVKDITISGTCTGCSAGSQTPWTQAIDGAGYALTNAGRIVATYFTATSTTATSTFRELSFTNATGTNLSVTGSSSFAWMNLGSTTANTLAVPSLTSAILLTNGSGLFAEYAGSGACSAGQAVTAISALGVTTCAAFADSSIFTYPAATFATTTTALSLPNSGFIGFMGNVAVDTTNYSLFGNTTLTLLNARSGASIGFRIANANVANFTTTGGFGFGSTFYNLDPGQNNMTVEGNLGVGVSAPTYKLDVTGNGHFTSLVDASNFVATSTTVASTFNKVTFTNATGTAATTTASFFSTFLTSLSSNATKYNATGTGVANQSVFQNATFVNSTSTSASSTNLYSNFVQGLTALFTNVTATGTLTLPTIVSQTLITDANGLVSGTTSPLAWSFTYSTTTATAATETIPVAGAPWGRTFNNFGCTSNGGTANAQFGDGSSSSTMVTSATGNTTTFTALSSNNAFISGEVMYVALGTWSGTGVRSVYCSAKVTKT